MTITHMMTISAVHQVRDVKFLSFCLQSIRQVRLPIKCKPPRFLFLVLPVGNHRQLHSAGTCTVACRKPIVERLLHRRAATIARGRDAHNLHLPGRWPLPMLGDGQGGVTISPCPWPFWLKAASFSQPAREDETQHRGVAKHCEPIGDISVCQIL